MTKVTPYVITLSSSTWAEHVWLYVGTICFKIFVIVSLFSVITDLTDLADFCVHSFERVSQTLRDARRENAYVAEGGGGGRGGYNLKFFTKNRSKYFFLQILGLF